MFGTKFLGHPNSRRILTDHGSKGHPLRKDSPLTGHIDISYNDSIQAIPMVPLELCRILDLMTLKILDTNDIMIKYV